MGFMESTDPNAFLDFPGKLKAPASDHYLLGGLIECPVCQGHGGWNLQLNAYPLHGKPDTPENRHTFSHFRAVCSQCFGYGWIAKDSKHATCPRHEWREKAVGRCLHEWTCRLCGARRVVDSSD